MPNEPTDSLENKNQREDDTGEAVKFTPKIDNAAINNSSLAAIESESGELHIEEAQAGTLLEASTPHPLNMPDESLNVAAQSIQKKRSKKYIIGGIVAALLVVLVGGGVGVYAWYQHPEKVVMDGLVNAANAKTHIIDTTIKAENKAGTYTIALDAKSNANGDIAGTGTITVVTKSLKTKPLTMSFEGEMVQMKNGDIYVFAKDIEKSVDTLFDSIIMQTAENFKKSGQTLSLQDISDAKNLLKQMYAPTLEVIDNQWIKLSKNDLKELNKDTGSEYECLQKVYGDIATDKKYVNEVSDIYKKSNVFTVRDSGQAKGDYQLYTIDIDSEALKKANSLLGGTAFGKKVQACSKEPSATDDESSKDKDEVKFSQVKVWIHKWNHTISDFSTVGKTEGEQEGTFTIDGKMTFDQPVSIEVPQDTKSITVIQDELKAILKSFNAQDGSSPIGTSSSAQKL